MLELFPFSTVLSYDKSKPYYPVHDNTRFRRNHFCCVYVCSLKILLWIVPQSDGTRSFHSSSDNIWQEKNAWILFMRKLFDEVGVLFVWVSIMENAIIFVQDMQCLELWLDKYKAVWLTASQWASIEGDYLYFYSILKILCLILWCTFP